MTKKNIYRSVNIRYDIDGQSLSQLAKTFEKLSKEYPEEACLDISVGSWDDIEACITYTSLETDEEYQARLLREKSDKEYRKKMFEQLKKEFG